MHGLDAQGNCRPAGHQIKFNKNCKKKVKQVSEEQLKNRIGNEYSVLRLYSDIFEAIVLDKVERYAFQIFSFETHKQTNILADTRFARQQIKWGQIIFDSSGPAGRPS